jgi:CO/xanthine dehydrogenase Mo-binding subunit
MSVGQRVRRPDAPDKVKGTALYVDDLAFAGALFGGVLRSPHAHARIADLDIAQARSVPGVRAVISAREIPGKNVVPLVQTDWPILASEYVRHTGEPVALVAAETPEALRQGLAAIVVDYEPLVAMLDLEQALAAGEVMAHSKVRRGDSGAAMMRADAVVVEAAYRTPYQEHAYLEPHGMIALPDGAGGVTVHGSMECPFYVQKAVASALGTGLHRVRVVPSVTGGGFGGKEETPCLPGAHAALLAMSAGKPVRLVLSRDEDMVVTSKRHPARIMVRLAAAPDGQFLAAEVDCLLDGGAYATLSPLVLFRSAVHACGPYQVPNVRVDARVVRTHKVPSGAFRGNGEPQVAFAVESLVDVLAERLGLDPLEIRRRNALDVGSETITGHKLTASVGLRDVLSRVAQSSEWQRKRKEYAADAGPLRRGIGVAASYSGIGLGAIGKHLNPAAASVVVAADGTVSVAVGTVDAGGGMLVTLAQIAAEALGCPVEMVRVIDTDTSRVPDSGPTGEGRTVVMSGNAIREAALKIRGAMQPFTSDRGLSWTDAVTACVQNQVGLAAYGWAVPPDTPFDPAAGQGEPYIGYSFSANVVEVELDTATGETRVLRVHSAHDAGRVLNPTAAEGQIEGGVVQGLGYALTEEHVVKDGRIANDRFSTYVVPSALDAPEIRTILVEHHFPWGPYGAKGLGDAPIAAVAPAVTAAIAHAGGVRLDEIPATPERVLVALRRKAAE